MNEPEEIKVVLIGDSGVGKTSIISQFINHKFDPYCQISLNSEFSIKVIEYPEYHKSLKFNIWDTVGQEKYRSLAKIFYKNAEVIILVYDLTSERSFSSIKDYWYNEIVKNANNNPILVLVGNKADLRKDDITYYNESCKNYANEIKAIFGQISALSYSGVSNLFEKIGKKIIDPECILDDTISTTTPNEISDLKTIKSNQSNKTEKSCTTNESRRTKRGTYKLKSTKSIINNEKKKCC
jgi:small GTP-binding protein